jgi:hypothetical protein
MPPAEGFSELEKMKAEQSKAEFEQAQRVSAQTDKTEDRRSVLSSNSIVP